MSFVNIPMRHVHGGRTNGGTRIEEKITCDRCGVSTELTFEDSYAMNFSMVNTLANRRATPHGPWTSYVVVTGRHAAPPDGKGFNRCVKTGMIDLCGPCNREHYEWFRLPAYARERDAQKIERDRIESAARAEAARIAEEKRVAEAARLAAEEAERVRVENERDARERAIAETRERIVKLKRDALRFVESGHAVRAVKALLERDTLTEKLSEMEAA